MYPDHVRENMLTLPGDRVATASTRASENAETDRSRCSNGRTLLRKGIAQRVRVAARLRRFRPIVLTVGALHQASAGVVLWRQSLIRVVGGGDQPSFRAAG
jgi:hypothetical protein